MTTNRQKSAVGFCEEMLDVKFKGNLNNFEEVSNFLSLYLDVAKTNYEDACESYYGQFDW